MVSPPQQKISAYKPKKAAKILTDTIDELLNAKLTPNKKASLSLDIEKWLRNTNK